MTSYPNPVGIPVGGTSVSGTSITVDDLTKPVTVVAPIIADLVEQSRGWFARDIFAMPGMTVDVAIKYQDVLPEDLFLDATASLAPRAPLAESPLVSGSRQDVKLALPRSAAGSFEVSDEARQENLVWGIQQLQRQVANTFAYKMQSWAMQALEAFITASGRTDTSTAPWRKPHTGGLAVVNPLDMPHTTLAEMTLQFESDLAGVLPDIMVVHPDDAYWLRTIYGSNSGVQDMLDDYGLRMIVSPLRTEGAPLFVKSQQVGMIAFQKPLTTEEERLTGGRWGDRYNLEMKPIFVANDATALLELTGVDATS